MVAVAYTGLSLLIVVIWVVGLVDLFRHRSSMEGWQVVLWALLIIFIPLVGIIPYLFWRIAHSEAMSDALSVPRDGLPPEDRAITSPGDT